MRRKKLWAATILLPVGANLCATTAETHVLWWGVAGMAMLLMVPGLIVDAVFDEIRIKQQQQAMMRGD